MKLDRYSKTWWDFSTQWMKKPNPTQIWVLFVIKEATFLLLPLPQRIYTPPAREATPGESLGTAKEWGLTGNKLRGHRSGSGAENRERPRFCQKASFQFSTAWGISKMQPPTNERWKGRGGKGARPTAATGQWKQGGGKLWQWKQGSQSLAVGEVFNKNILKPASLSTFTQSRQRREPSLLFLLAMAPDQHQGSLYLLRPRSMWEINRKGPLGRDFQQPRGGEALTAKACVSVNTFLTASGSSQLLLTHLGRPDCRATGARHTWHL